MTQIGRATAGDLETIVEFNIKLAGESDGVELDRDRLDAKVVVGRSILTG